MAYMDIYDKQSQPFTPDSSFLRQLLRLYVKAWQTAVYMQMPQTRKKVYSYQSNIFGKVFEQLQQIIWNSSQKCPDVLKENAAWP